MPAIITITDDEKVIVIYGVDAARAVVDDGLVELALLISEGETDLAAQIAAGEASIASALAGLTPLVADAAASAAAAVAAAAVFRETIAVGIENDTVLEPGGWIVDYSTGYDFRVSRFVGLIDGGTGTVNVSIVDGSDVVYGPVGLSTTLTDNDGLGFLIPAGSDLSVFVEDIAGTPTSAFVKIEGRPE